MDRDLIARAQRGDEAAFAELVGQIGDRLYAAAHHIVRDTGRADDAAQQAMIEIWRNIPALKDPDRFMAWAYRIVVRAALAEATSHRRWKIRLNLASIVPTAAVASDHADTVAARDELDRALDRLPEDHRAVVVLKHFAGLSNPEIAAVLEIPEGTVRSRLHYAISSMRASLDADRRPHASPIEP